MTDYLYLTLLIACIGMGVRQVILTAFLIVGLAKKGRVDVRWQWHAHLWATAALWGFLVWWSR